MTGNGRSDGLTHYDAEGRVRQVDVGGKEATERVAEARGLVRMGAETRDRVRAGGLKKGDPLEVARVAAIAASKRTAELIPLCHMVPLSQLDVIVELTDEGVEIRATAKARWMTGVEMEALTAVSVGALTVYDMLKAVDRSLVIDAIRLVRKTGGKSGDFLHTDLRPDR